MATGMWRLGGRISTDNTYFFYQLAHVPGFGVTITGWRIVPIDWFWGTR